MQTTNRTLIALLLLIGLVTPTFQQCNNNNNDLLQSGSSLLFNARSATRQHLFSVTANFNVPSSGLKVVASLSSLQYSVVGGMDFSVRGLSGQSFGSVQIVLLIDEDNSWSNIRVSYLISGRTDFFLGSYSADIYLVSKYSTSITVQFPVPNWTPSQSIFTSVAEFSGVRTSANSFAISFGTLSLNPATGLITVVITTSTLVAIENIFIAFIVFPNSAPFTFTTYNPSFSSPGTYSFVGLDSIRSSGSIFSGSAFTPSASNGINCVGSRCPSLCITAQMCTISGGQISGNTCYLCGPGQVVINGNCQTSNRCGPNEYWSGTQCLCVSGYIRVNGICYQMCAANAYIFQNQCVCIPNYVYSTTAGQCVLQTNCGPNFVLSNGNCVCPPPFGIINNLCLTCPPNSSRNSIGNCQCVNGFTLSSNTLTCVPQTTCLNGQVFNGIRCVCPTGQYIDAISGQCTFCNSFGQAVQGITCVCSPIFYPTNNGCAPCPANSAYSSTTNQCTCLPGFTSSNGQCVSSPSCPSGAQWNPATSSCQCTTPGFFIINGVCAACPANSQWDGTACKCNNNFSMVNGVCVSTCPLGSVWNGVSCVCSSGYYLIGGNCVVCDPNSSYNSAQSTCLCNSGYYGNWQRCFNCDSSCATCSGPANTQCTSCRGTSTLNSNGRCTTGCPAGQYVNPSNNCSPCIANCVLCYSGDSCTTCASGFGTSLTVVNGNIVVACTPVPTGTSSRLTLRSNVVGNEVVYQGVAMSLMPTQILADGCTICDELLLVKVVSSYASATASVSFVTNSQYWFLITFDFTGAPFIPNFQFTVQINPIHANYFTAPDMAQKLVGAVDAQGTTPFAPIAPPSGGGIAVGNPRSGGSFGSSGTTPTVPAKNDKKILASVFG